MKSIGSFYKVDIVFDVKAKEDDCKINTKYSGETLEQVLKELAVIVGLKYENTNGKIIIKSYKC